MYISIDTSTMRQIAVLALNLKDEMDAANLSVSSIVEHDDWNCIERDQINDNIANIKKKNAVLVQDAEAFSSTVNGIADKFDEFDVSLTKSFSSFDVSVGKLISLDNQPDGYIPWHRPTGYIHKSLPDLQSKLMDSPKIKENNLYRIEVTGIHDSINVVNFADIKNTLLGKQSFEHIDSEDLFNKYFK